MKKSMLYIKHKFQSKTKSNDFLQNLLKEKYDIEIVDFDPYSEDASLKFNQLKGKHFDVLVLFQIMPSMEIVKKNINFSSGVFFPMYDAAIDEPDIKWFEYKDFNIINFSKTLHEKLIKMGLSSYYIQYFPKPVEVNSLGEDNSIFFWQRLTKINYNYFGNLFSKMDIKNLHIHKSLDPNQEFVEPKNVNANIEYSTWYDKKEDMFKDIEKAAIYIAPRYYEGIGLSFLEAMAMGRCVVAIDNPTMNEYIEHKKNGILYPQRKSKIKPLININIKEIQKNTIEFIKQGYEKWEQDKYKILDWVEASSIANEDIMGKYKSNLKSIRRHYLFNFIPFLSIENRIYSKITTYKLFNFLPVLICKNYEQKTKYFIFGFLPILKVIKD